jgi:hypothetical protein
MQQQLSSFIVSFSTSAIRQHQLRRSNAGNNYISDSAQRLRNIQIASVMRPPVTNGMCLSTSS